jgi:hypothetical protein
MSQQDPNERLKKQVEKLVNQEKVTRVAATCFLFSKGIVLLPNGFRHLTQAEYEDGIKDVQEALAAQESQDAQAK